VPDDALEGRKSPRSPIARNAQQLGNLHARKALLARIPLRTKMPRLSERGEM